MPALHVALLVAWISLPVAGGPAFGDALAHLDAAAAPRFSAALWVLWALGTGSLVAPSAASMTAARLMVPAGGLLGCWAATIGDTGPAQLAAAGAGAAATVLVFTARVGARFVDGSSYGDERRFALRCPAALLLGPVPLVGLLVVLGAAVGPTLLLQGTVLGGLVACALGLPLAAWGVRVLHRLSRRWIVFVPAGMVLHDHLVLTEPVLFARSRIAALRPAPVGSDARDLTAGAPGLALQLELREPTRLGLAARRGELPATEDVLALLCTPSLPGEVLATARERRIPVPV